MVEEAKFLPGTEELWLGAEGRDSSYAALSPSWAAAESESLLGYNGNSVAGSQPSPVSDADMSLSRKILDAQPPWTTGDCMQRLFGAACGRRNRRGQTAGRRCRLSGETLRSSHIRSQKPPPAVAQRPGFSAVGVPATRGAPSPLGSPGRPSMSGTQELPPARTQLRGFSAVKDQSAFRTSAIIWPKAKGSRLSAGVAPRASP